MPDEESRPAEPAAAAGELDAAGEPDAQLKGKQAAVQSESDDDDEPAVAEQDAATQDAAAEQSGSSKKRKKSKKSKKSTAIKGAASGSTPETQMDFVEQALRSLSPQQLEEFLSLNPALKQEVNPSGKSEDIDVEKITERIKRMDIGDILTGLAAGGKNAKDMASYQFWQTQPVPRFGEDDLDVEEGPLKIQTVDEIAKDAASIMSTFKWVTMDLTDDKHMKEVYELLNGHYVEDDEAMFRFNYTPGILKWAVMAPGWKREYHVGVRTADSQKLVAFISAVPVDVRVRGNVFKSSEVNFLCVHKKLRGKRLAPVLIKEITRISNLDGIWQGLFTAGIVLPKPVSTCRYYHRPLNWQKLYECNFVHLPANSKSQYQIRKYALPVNTSTKGLRVMRPEDIEGVLNLMERFMAKYDIAPKMNKEEATHWFTPTVDPEDSQFIWSYVVEDQNQKITDYFSFYCIESSAINNPKHKIIRVAYLFYYATEVGLSEPASKEAITTRLNGLINDALIIAKKAKFDVFNALSLMDNALFLEQQKFGPGDGQLHYYLFNYRANPIAGGVTGKNVLDVHNLSGVGFVLP